MKKIFLPIILCGVALATNAQTRVPLFEVFTSSTCPPCNNGNVVYENVLQGKPTSEYVSIKYQQNFPGTGDPYTTAETVSRRSAYYAINSIPRMEIDGGWNQNAASFTNALYTQYKAVPATFTVAGAWTYNASTKTVTARVKYKPLNGATLTGNILYVAIVESPTVQNKKTNGETVFYNVVKKMLPNQNGTALSNLAVNKTDSTTLTFQFNGNFRLPADGQATSYINNATEHSVENFNNLKVVAWVQNTNKAVQNAANLMKVNSLGIENVSRTIEDFQLAPNPASSFVTLNLQLKSSETVSIMITNMQGMTVATHNQKLSAGEQQILIDTKNFANGVYNVIVNDGNSNSFTKRLVVTH